MGSLTRTGGGNTSQKRKLDDTDLQKKDEDEVAEDEIEGPDPKRQAVPTISKNDYFAYADGKRAPDQSWNLPGMYLVLKGEINGITAPGDASRNTRTYFASNHMLTFKGGKRWVAAQAPDGATSDAKSAIEAKGSSILAKRQLKGYNRTQAVTDKYGGTTNKNAKQRARAPGNTFIICDRLPKQDLQNLFRLSILSAIRSTRTNVNVEATLNFAAYPNTVLVVERNGTKVYKTMCSINFDYLGNITSGLQVLVKHLKS